MNKVKVRAVLKPGARELHDRGLLFPHPNGQAGHWLGWRECGPDEEAEHVIPGAPGLAADFRSQTSDMFYAGDAIRLRRLTDPVEVDETADIRRALRDGDLTKVV